MKRRFSVPGSLTKETTFAYYTWLVQSIKTDIRKSIDSAMVFNYFNDIIDCLQGSKSNDALFYSKLYQQYADVFCFKWWFSLTFLFYGHATFFFHLVAEFIIYFVLHIYRSRFKWSFPICFLKKQFKGLAEKLYTEHYPHHLNYTL